MKKTSLIFLSREFLFRDFYEIFQRIEIASQINTALSRHIFVLY